MEVFAGDRGSGKTTRAILWMLQNWPDGVILQPDWHRVKYTRNLAVDLTGLPPECFIRNVTLYQALPLWASGLKKRRYLLDEIRGFPEDVVRELTDSGKVVAYTCSP